MGNSKSEIRNASLKRTAGGIQISEFRIPNSRLSALALLQAGYRRSAAMSSIARSIGTWATPSASLTHP